MISVCVLFLFAVIVFIYLFVCPCLHFGSVGWLCVCAHYSVIGSLHCVKRSSAVSRATDAGAAVPNFG